LNNDKIWPLIGEQSVESLGRRSDLTSTGLATYAEMDARVGELESVEKNLEQLLVEVLARVDHPGRWPQCLDDEGQLDDLGSRTENHGHRVSAHWHG
jgi:hypothetical protein